MEFIVQLFLIFLATGLTLLGAEIFVPGGILGTIGGFSLVGAIITGFKAFPGYGTYIAVGIIVLAGVAIAAWIKFFPKTPLGRKMTVSNDLASAKGTESGLNDLIGKEGEAVSELRPAGFAMIDNRRVDVLTQGEMISRGERIQVIDIEANRVIVSKVHV